MQHVMKGYRSLSVVFTVNSDRLASAGMVMAGLACGAVMGSFLLAA